MYRNKVILLVIFALMLTGCTRLDNNIDNIVSATMTKEIDLVNTVSTGYELYVPIGVIQDKDSEYNQKFKIRDTYVYLYVDTVSYYYKNNLNHKSGEEYNYYYKDINLNNKVGYIGIKSNSSLAVCPINYAISKGGVCIHCCKTFKRYRYLITSIFKIAVFYIMFIVVNFNISDILC